MTQVKISTKHRFLIVLVYKILPQFDGLKLKNDKIRKMIQEEERKKWAEENKDLLKEQEERFKEEQARRTAEM